MQFKFDSKGVSLYLAIVVLSVLTATLLSLLGIVLSQNKAISALSDSVVAFYAADTGIEEVLYCIFGEGWAPDVADRGNCISFFGSPCDTCGLIGSGCGTETLANNANYEVCISPTSETTIWSTGVYKGTTRRIEINF